MKYVYVLFFLSCKFESYEGSFPKIYMKDPFRIFFIKHTGSRHDIAIYDPTV